MGIKEKIDFNKLPKHVAIIMDGNGRWAKKRGILRVLGHRQGIKSVRTVVETAAELGVEYLTLYTFSTENWNRPQFEVNALMELFVTTIAKEINALKQNNIRLNAIGDLNSLPEKCRKELEKGMQETASSSGCTLTLALSYSARWEIVRAAKLLAQKVAEKQLIWQDIDEDMFVNHLCTSNLPDPELLIRTSGEFRISNYLLFQIAYTELYFTEKFWPDFGKDDFYEAILSYQHRERRFGKTSEQTQKP